MRETSPAVMREERDQPGVVDLCSSAHYGTGRGSTMLPVGVVVGCAMSDHCYALALYLELGGQPS